MSRIADTIKQEIEDRNNRLITAQLAVEEHARKFANRAVTWICNRAIRALKKEAKDGYSIAFFNIQKPIFSRYHACELTLELANKKLFAEGIRLNYDSSDFRYVTKRYDKSSLRSAPIDSGQISAFLFNDFKCIKCDESISDPTEVRAIYFGKYMCSECEVGSSLIGDKEVTFEISSDKSICPECKQPNLDVGNYFMCHCDGITPFLNALSLSNLYKGIKTPREELLSKYSDLDYEFTNKGNK